jgi:hypothetical protein
MSVNRPPPPPPPPPSSPDLSQNPSDQASHHSTSSDYQSVNSIASSHGSNLSNLNPFHIIQRASANANSNVNANVAPITTSTATNAVVTTTLKIRSATLPADFIQILITPHMTHDDFAHCIAHAALSPPQAGKLLENWSVDEGGTNWTRIAGLFREGDEVFIPISLLLQNPQQYKDDLFRISRFIQPKPRPIASSLESLSRSSLLIQFVKRNRLKLLFFGLFCTFVNQMDVDYSFLWSTVFEYIEYGIHWILNLPSEIIENCIDHPLKETYRNGPSVIGWEGSSLANICSQVTHMGDETFWTRNMDECEKIYRSKETAMLYVRKPLLYLVLIVCLFYTVQSFMKTWAIQRQNRPHTEMVEIYEAFNLITKIIRRGMMPPSSNNFKPQ